VMFDAAGSRGYILMLFVTHRHVHVCEARARPRRRVSVRHPADDWTDLVIRLLGLVGLARDIQLAKPAPPEEAATASPGVQRVNRPSKWSDARQPEVENALRPPLLLRSR
jgi:hypothetical protein